MHLMVSHYGEQAGMLHYTASATQETFRSNDDNRTELRLAHVDVDLAACGVKKSPINCVECLKSVFNFDFIEIKDRTTS